MLWISSFDAAGVPPATDLPCIVLGPPALRQRLPAAACVFIAVATPGLGAAGHLLRTDGIVVVPLERMRDDGLPAVADVLARVEGALPAARRTA